MKTKHLIVIIIVSAIILIWYLFLKKHKPSTILKQAASSPPSPSLQSAQSSRTKWYSGADESSWSKPINEISIPISAGIIGGQGTSMPIIAPDYSYCQARYNAMINQPHTVLSQNSLYLSATQRLNSCKACMNGCYNQYNQDRNGIRVDLKAAADYRLGLCKTACQNAW